MASGCPNCGFAYVWDGAACGHCRYPRPADPPPADWLVEELARWRLWLWVPGLLLAAVTGWYPADRWQSYREATPAWCIVAGGAGALALASVALLPVQGRWWARAVRWLVSVVVYLIAAAIVWFGTMMRGGFGGG